MVVILSFISYSNWLYLLVRFRHLQAILFGCCYTFYHLRILLRHEYHIRQLVMFFHRSYKLFRSNSFNTFSKFSLLRCIILAALASSNPLYQFMKSSKALGSFYLICHLIHNYIVVLFIDFIVSHIQLWFSVDISFIRFHHLQAVLCGCSLSSCWPLRLAIVADDVRVA